MSEPKLVCACDHRGSSMGRSNGIYEPHERIKFRLYKMSIDSGGYDNGGAYWGTGNPMYRAVGEGPLYVNELYTRAATREEAKAAVLRTFPHATFYR